MKLKILHLFLVIFFFSCEFANDFEGKNQNSFDASADDLIAIAIMQAPFTDKASVGRTNKVALLGSPIGLPIGKIKPTMYLFKYEDGGFVIISADKRMSPVLAYSKFGDFVLNEEEMPPGLVDWIYSTDHSINSLTVTVQSKIFSETLEKIWRNYREREILNLTSAVNGRSSTTVYIGDCNNGDSGFTEYSYGETSTPTWNQGNGYNDLCPYLGCSSPSNGRVWTGCVATAVAEVMKFYNYPTIGYNWSQMPTNAPSSETARLMLDLGTSGNLSTIYSCSGSTSYPSNIPRTMLNFGYHSVSYGNYDIWTAKGNLQDGHPIILSGNPNLWTAGHCWVADGVQYWGYYSCEPDPNTPGEWIAVNTGYDCSLKMNWGWGGAYNGWYSANNFNPGGDSYNTNRKMVYGINP